MKLFYKNETLYIFIDMILNEENLVFLKRKIFHIIHDYDIDHIVLDSQGKFYCNRRFLHQIAMEYRERFRGDFLIK